MTVAQPFVTMGHHRLTAVCVGHVAASALRDAALVNISCVVHAHKNTKACLIKGLRLLIVQESLYNISVSRVEIRIRS